MFLTILRHATAAHHEEYAEDGQRPLVPKGLEQLERVGSFCRSIDLVPELVLTSPVLRARQTAASMTRLGRWPEPMVEGWLSCGMQPEEGLRQLRAFGDFESAALVGHEPDLSLLLAHLLGTHGEAFRLRKACLVGLELHSLRPGAGILHHFVPCRVMPR